MIETTTSIKTDGKAKAMPSKQKKKLTIEELSEQIKAIQKLRKKRRFSSSRLNPHLEEIFHFYYADGASCADIALWLQKNKRIKVSRQAVLQFINKHAETVGM